MDASIDANIDKIIKHLEMIQGIVNRLARNSFLLKGWSITLLSATLVVVARDDMQNSLHAFFLILALPVFGFWTLDGYYLYQERIFRKLYDEVRKQPDTDFAMNVAKHNTRPKRNWMNACFSVTELCFYGVEILVVIFIGIMVGS